MKMASTNRFPQFIKYIRCDESSSDEIRVPQKFTNEHSNPLSENWILSLRNGYKIPVRYDSTNSTLVGVRDLLVDFGVMGVQVMPCHMMHYSHGVDVSTDFFRTSVFWKKDTITAYNGVESWKLEVRKRKFVDRLGGIMSCNVNSTGLVVYDLVITKKHLTNKEYTKVLKRSACKTLGIRQSMEFVDLSFKDFSWTVKFIVGSGIGHRTGVLNWYKVVDDIFLSGGQMEIPRVYTEITGGGMKKIVKLIMADGKSVFVRFFAGKNLIYGLENLVNSYSIELNDIPVFTYASDSTFSVSCFKYSGIEYHHNSEELDALIEEEAQETIMLSDSSDASDNNLVLDHAPQEVEEMVMEVSDEEQDNNSFLVTLKKSHVDKKVHGVRFSLKFAAWVVEINNNVVAKEVQQIIIALLGLILHLQSEVKSLSRGFKDYAVMAFHDNEVPRIFKVALKDTCLSGVMTLPKKFSEYTGRIPANVQIILKDGFEWNVKFWKERNSLHGLKALLEYYGCSTGAFLLMEYNGGGRFMCDIFPAYEGCERWTDECDLLGKYIMKIVVYQGDDFDELCLCSGLMAWRRFQEALTL
uniref:TF-B3 domain-containing protein n=1 Tax=Daucus carota subsp. sativus TaxID=79200 RepID=A0A164T890_DAUCS